MDYVATRIEKTANGRYSGALEFLKDQDIIPGLRWNDTRQNIERLAGDFKYLCMSVESPYGKAKDHPRVKWTSPEDMDGQGEALEAHLTSTFKSWSYEALRTVKYVVINHETQYWDRGGPEIVHALKKLYTRYSEICPNAIVTFYNQGQKKDPTEVPFWVIPFGVPYILKRCSLYEDRSAANDEIRTIESTEPDQLHGSLGVSVNLCRFWDYPNHKGPRVFTRYGPSRTPNFEKGQLIGTFQDRPIRAVFISESVPPWEEDEAITEEFQERFLAFKAGVDSISLTE